MLLSTLILSFPLGFGVRQTAQSEMPNAGIISNAESQNTFTKGSTKTNSGTSEDVRRENIAWMRRVAVRPEFNLCCVFCVPVCYVFSFASVF